MRKLRKVFVMFFLLGLMLPTAAFFQTVQKNPVVENKVPQNTKQEKITVHKDGSMTDSKGQKVDRKLFALSTYDAEGKEQMRKGEATKRPDTMYLSEDLLKANALTQAQKDQIDEYIKAEKQPRRVNPVAATASRNLKRNPPANNARKNPPPAIQIVRQGLTEADRKDIADKIAAQINVKQTSGLSTKEFKEEVDKIVAQAKKELSIHSANLKAGNPEPSPAPSPITSTDQPDGSPQTDAGFMATIRDGATWVLGLIASLFLWIWGILFSWIGIALLVLIIAIIAINRYRTRRVVDSGSVLETHEQVVDTTSEPAVRYRWWNPRGWVRRSGKDHAFDAS